MNHRGRFQAQGTRLQESEKWAQMNPFSIISGREKLNALKLKLTERDRKRRLHSFSQCRRFINRANKNGGVFIAEIGHPLIKSFPKNHKERVDLEVHLGIAFVTIVNDQQ